MKRTFLLAPSLLSADFSNLSSAISLIEERKADWVHIDVMDGHFVPNLTYGPPVIASLRKRTALPFDVHLMTENAETAFLQYIEAGADWITFHAEGVVHAHRLITAIKAKGVKAGISIVPSTPVSTIVELLPFVDLVLIMTVNPGFGGQVLLPFCLDKVALLKKMKQENGFSYIVSVDGGVNGETLPAVIQAGADVIVSGSAFFSGELV